jgi:hypothetical protein
MEFNLNNKPNFTDPVILSLTNLNNWLSVTTNTRKYIKLKNSTIEVFLSLYPTKPTLEIIFRDDNYAYIGGFTYILVKNSTNEHCYILRSDCLFLDGFGASRSYLVTSQAIEKLMEYPDIKEWLIWNRP